MKYLFSLMISILFMSSALLAQSPKSDDYQNRKLDRLQSFLNLTDIQVDQIKTELAELQSDETTGHHHAMKEAMTKVLTPKQMGKLHSKEAWKKHRRPHRHMWHRADKEVQDKLVDMRQTLDAEISEEDKATIISIREAKAQLHASCQMEKNTFNETSLDDKKKFKRHMDGSKRGSNPNFIKAKALAEKYSPEIIDVFKENEAFFMELKAAQRAESERKAVAPPCEDCDCHPVPRESEELGREYSLHKRIAFLLMDTRKDKVEEVELREAKPNTVTLYPNPTSDQTQLSFTVKTAANIQVDVRDQQGRLMHTIVNRYYEAGDYTKEINTTTYESGTYLVSFYDGTSVQTEKLIIQK